MDHMEEINHRKMLMERIRQGEKITREERLWLATHRLINWKLGYPHLNTDMICVQPKECYRVRVQVESAAYEGRILPVITVPAGKGSIVCSLELTDYAGNSKTGRSVKMLGLQSSMADLDYRSELGLLGVSYECDYYDAQLRHMQHIDSELGWPEFAMLREDLSDQKVVYRCKAPASDKFDGLVFSIEWERKNSRQL